MCRPDLFEVDRQGGLNQFLNQHTLILFDMMAFNELYSISLVIEI